MPEDKLVRSEACRTCAMQLKCLVYGIPKDITEVDIDFECRCGFSLRSYMWDNRCLKQIVFARCINGSCQKYIPLYGVGSIEARKVFYAKRKRRSKK